MNPCVRFTAVGFASLCLAAFVTSAEPTAPDPPYLSTQDAQLQQADRLEQSDRYQEAIPIYESIIQNGEGRDLRWTAYIMFRLACAQYQSGDRMNALESAQGAATLDPQEPSYQAFVTNISAARHGAAQPVVYHAYRNSGSARKLSSKNGVLHIFVRGQNTDPWDPELEEKTRLQIEESDQWLQARSAETPSGPAPVFTHRFLALADEPFWRRINVPDTDSSSSYRKAWLDAILVRFQAASYEELFNHVFEGQAFDNRAVVFHAAKEEAPLSIRLPCRQEPTDVESVLVQSQPSGWDNSHDAVTYTHGLLHLYGADDLYNKAPDPEIPEQDVMNFGAHSLDECEICALTRYAIGWTDHPPHLTRLRLASTPNHTRKTKGAHG
jgi:tetratricopeptide (TPR) repeat protein